MSEHYAKGFEIGRAWAHDHAPGGPWYPRRCADTRAAKLRAEHDAWMAGFAAGRVAQ